SDRVRLSLRLLVSDRIRRGEPVRLFGNRHQNLFDGANAQAISHVREAVDAGGMARSGPAYSCGARRRHRAGATVLQYAESQSRRRLTEIFASQLSFTANRHWIALRRSVIRGFAASTCRSRLFRNPPKPVVQAFAN